MDTPKKIKILYVGNDEYSMYVKAFYNASFNIPGLIPELVSWNQFLEKNKINLCRKFENKMSFGIYVHKFNQYIVDKCKDQKYDIIFLYSCRMIYNSSIREMKKTGSYIACYNNDNPFSRYYPSYFWRWYRRNIKECNTVYSYRHSNIEECEKWGGKNNKLLRSYYIKEKNFYIPEEKLNLKNIPDVVFMGHFENDDRMKYIRALLEADIKLGVPEVAWKKYEEEYPNLVMLKDTHRQYNEIINKSKIAINFLSSINCDTYTRRCFEIPATKTLMLSVYTEDIASMLAEDKEVVFFRTPQELVDKIKFYLSNDSERKRIADNGYLRILKDGHEATDRVKQLINDFLIYKN